MPRIRQVPKFSSRNIPYMFDWKEIERFGLEKFSIRENGHYPAVKVGLRAAKIWMNIELHYRINVMLTVHSVPDEHHLRLNSICYNTTHNNWQGSMHTASYRVPHVFV
ncbi:hypothetical protein Trydic_g14826 [Trypoxylus dichotomus]